MFKILNINDSIVNNKTKFEMISCIIDCLFSLQPFKLKRGFLKIYFVHKQVVSNDINQQILSLHKFLIPVNDEASFYLIG